METQEQKIKVLLVDDEVLFLNATGSALSRRGFEVTKATHGDQAIELLERDPFHVIVLDVKMPGRDGFSLLEEIKQRWPDMAVIMLTGHGSMEQAVRAAQQGVYDYLTKPCTIEKLTQLVEKAATGALLSHAPAAQGKEEIRLLIIDDEVDLLASLSAVLGRRGIRVATARSGEEGLFQIAQEEFDVIVLDLTLPGPSGIDVLRRIKDIHPLTEVILLTGHPSMGTAAEGVKEGVFDYLIKPQSVQTLTARIRAAFQHRKMQLQRQR